MSRQYHVYLLANPNRTTIYTGVTNDLKRRIQGHKAKLTDGFTKRYNTTRLVYYETFRDPRTAIAREKQIKGGSRAQKLSLIQTTNRFWKDLYWEL